VKLKPTLVVLLFVSICMLGGVLLFNYQKQEGLRAELARALQAEAQKVAHNVNLFMYEKIERVKGLSTSNIILKRLYQSNQKFAELNETEREK